MPGKTRTFTVTDAVAVAIIATGYTSAITVQEDPSVAGWPTTNFTVQKPTSADTAIQRPIGGQYTFQVSLNNSASYAPGDVAGYVRLVAGAASTTFQQDEA